MNAPNADTAETKLPTFSLRFLFYFVTVVAICLGCLAIVRHRNAIRRAEHDRLLASNRETEKAFAVKVESMRAKLGRAPKDATELELLFGRSALEICLYGEKRPIQYYRQAENSFRLEYLTEGMTYIRMYDSNNPGAGWLEVPDPF